MNTNGKIYPYVRLDAQAAANYLGLSPRTLANKRSDGSGPPFVRLGRIFYFQTDLDEWLLGLKRTGGDAARKRTASESAGKG